MKKQLFVFALSVAVPVARAQSTRVVKYQTTMKDVKYVHVVAEPAARLTPGDVLETNTVDAFGNAIQKPGDTLSMVKGDDPWTRPFYIEGAAPGDTLAVKILDLQVDSDQVWGLSHPGLALSVPPTTRPCRKKSGCIQSSTPTTPRPSRREIRIFPSRFR